VPEAEKSTTDASTMARPTTKKGVGRSPKSGMESSHESRMEMAIANPLMMLSVCRLWCV
jgi:hypothetical protein